MRKSSPAVNALSPAGWLVGCGRQKSETDSFECLVAFPRSCVVRIK